MKRLLLFAALGVFFTPSFARQDTAYPKKIYTTTEVSTPPEIDGWLNDEVWEKADWQGDFHMYEPYDDRPATQQTRFRVLFDRENIYLAIRAFDSAPDSIVKRLTRRDDLDGDMVAFQFDSYHDLQTAFVFAVSAAGSKMDAYESEDGNNMDETWNAVWWAKTQIDNQGWTAEIKIPFSQLRFDRSGGGVWGFQVMRELFRTSETSLWQPISKEAPGWIHLLGEIHGLQDIDPKKQAEITPYAVAGNQRYEKEPENPFRSEGQEPIFNAGLDAKIGITNNFTLDMTVNPDFGQVEADPSQVNLTAFETYFEEQRPFFMEGKNILDFDLAVYDMSNLFYSRRIGRRPHHHPSLGEGEYAQVPEFTNILGAAKVTGKTKNGLSIGIMESVTSREKAEIDHNGERSFETVEPLTSYFASSVSKEFNKGNTRLGGMITSTNRFNDEAHLDYLHTSALSGGIDFQHYFKERNYLLSFSTYMGRVNGSEEALIRTQGSPVHYFQRPDADYVTLDSARTSLSGAGGSLQLGKQSGRLRFMGFLYVNSPGLELNDLGFKNSTDEIFQIFWVGYRFNEPFSIFRSAALNINQWSGWDFGGNHQMVGSNLNGHAEFKNLWRAGFFLDADSEMRRNTLLRGGPAIVLPGGSTASLFVSTSSRKKLELEVDGYYYLGYEGSALSSGIEFALTYKPISNLNLSLETEVDFRQRELQYVTQENFTTDTRYVFGSIDQKTISMSVRVNLILTPEFSIQYWGQPFIASGGYSDFKYITNSTAESYHDRFHSYGNGEIAYDADQGLYTVTESGSGLNYAFEDPDFNIREFLSNLVFRWEYRPGSSIYLVWSQSRSGFDPYGQLQFKNDLTDIWEEHPTNVILLKVSYRLGR
ncbi:MAG: DUF5916 domain-containing protein [Bacteroidota bacterium]